MEIDISILIAIVGCAIGVSGWLKSNKKDDNELISTLSKLSVKLDTTCNTLTRLESQMMSTNSAVMNIKEDLVKLTVKYDDTARRVDDHSKRIKALEQKIAEIKKP